MVSHRPGAQEGYTLFFIFGKVKGAHVHLKLEVQSDLSMGAGAGSQQYALFPLPSTSALVHGCFKPQFQYTFMHQMIV